MRHHPQIDIGGIYYEQDYCEAADLPGYGDLRQADYDGRTFLSQDHSQTGGISMKDLKKENYKLIENYSAYFYGRNQL